MDTFAELIEILNGSGFLRDMGLLVAGSGFTLLGAWLSDWRAHARWAEDRAERRQDRRTDLVRGLYAEFVADLELLRTDAYEGRFDDDGPDQDRLTNLQRLRAELGLLTPLAIRREMAMAYESARRCVRTGRQQQPDDESFRLAKAYLDRLRTAVRADLGIVERE